MSPLNQLLSFVLSIFVFSVLFIYVFYLREEAIEDDGQDY